MPVTTKGVKEFQHKVLHYYAEKGRTLPWRSTRDPYKIFISEIMLQQTQVDCVKDYYNTWTRGWPSIHSLAKAARRDILTAWMGLGYNNRALRLHEAAKKIVKDYKGDVLAAMHDYKKIPGVGPYTASAVRIFSQNDDIVTVDTNIRRLLIHEFGLAENLSDKELWQLAEQCLPRGNSRDWHNALMDYGATLITSRRTGIKPKTQQSAFEGSNRQIRATLLKALLKAEKGKTMTQLQELAQEPSLARTQHIIWGMVKDGLLEKKEKHYILKE